MRSTEAVILADFEGNKEKGTITILLWLPSQNKTPARAMLRPGGRRNFLVRRRLCRRWAMSYPYPGSIPNSPEDGLTMPYPHKAVKVGGGPREEDRGDLAARVLGRGHLDALQPLAHPGPRRRGGIPHRLPRRVRSTILPRVCPRSPRPSAFAACASG